jgi:hypothetical protein
MGAGQSSTALNNVVTETNNLKKKVSTIETKLTNNSIICSDGELCSIPLKSGGFNFPTPGNRILEKDKTVKVESADKIGLSIGGNEIFWVNKHGVNVNPEILMLGKRNVGETLTKHSNDISGISGTITDHTGKITQNSTDIVNISGALVDHTGKIKQNSTDISNQGGAILEHKGQIAQIFKDNENQGVAIEDHTRNIATNAKDITDIKTAKAFNTDYIGGTSESVTFGKSFNNSWVFHAPNDDNRTNLYIAPGTKGTTFEWDKSFVINKKGDIASAGAVKASKGFGPYKFDFFKKGMCLDSREFTTSGNGVRQCTNDDEQKWNYDPIAGKIMNTKTGTCLDSNGPNSKWTLNDCKNHENQRFLMTSDGLLRAYGSDNKCLDSGNPNKQFTCDGSNDFQKFKVNLA